MNKTCQQTLYGSSFPHRYDSGLCGRPAKFKDESTGKFYCGIHRKVIDRFNKRSGKPECVKVES